jgi:hypothetical protein
MRKRFNDNMEQSLVVAFYDTTGAWNGIHGAEFRALRGVLHSGMVYLMGDAINSSQLSD